MIDLFVSSFHAPLVHVRWPIEVVGVKVVAVVKVVVVLQVLSGSHVAAVESAFDAVSFG